MPGVCAGAGIECGGAALVDAGEAAYAAVRARVMGRVMEGGGWSRRLGFAAGIAAAALVFFAIRAMEPPRIVEMPLPPPYHISAPETATPVVQAVKRRVARPRPRRTMLAAKTEEERPLTAIKLLTDDPNVVIIWLLDEKGGSE